MDERNQYLLRVREAAQAISSLASHGMNIPVEDYIDKTSLNALCDSLSMEPEAWRIEDLEKILIIRDGLYTLRNKLRDDGHDGEYSIEQLLSGMDRLYADLERAMRALNSAEVQKAQQEIAALQRTPQVDAQLAPSAVSDLREEAGQLLTRTHVTYQRFEVNVIKFENLNLNIEVMRNARLVVQRLSATVFAIKLSLEQNVIYQGVFRFLSEGADKIVDELRKLAEQFKRSYKQTDDFVSDLSVLVEKGHRFTKHIAEFLRDMFGDKPLEQKQLRLKTRFSGGMETMVSACKLDDGRTLLGGRNGYVAVVDAKTGRAVDQHRIGSSNINCLARGYDVVVAGTDNGLEIINPNTLVSLEHEPIYSERVSAVAVPPWGVLSGTRDGIVRRWKVQERSLQRYGSENLKPGKSIQRMLVHGDQVLTAAADNLVVIDNELQVVRKIAIDFTINDMCLLSHSTLIVCGNGKLAHVNLSKGIYTRFISAPEQTNYTCVCPIDESTFCVGADDGKIAAMDLDSSSEIGSTTIPFPIRGLLKAQANLIVFGGNWQGKSKSTMASLIWEEVLHKTKEIIPKPDV